MPTKLSTWLAAAALAMPGLAHASVIPITLDYSNRPGSTIQFGGNSTFWFSPTPNNFQITSAGAASGLLGEITGTFTIGAVTTVGPASFAPVTGNGSFVIHDGLGYDLTASLTWGDIVQTGSVSGLNTSSALNLTSISYGGANPLLAALALAPGSAANTLSFQFIPAKTLAQIKSQSTSTSFSGSVYAVRVPDSGATAVLMLVAITSLCARGRYRSDITNHCRQTRTAV